MQVYGLGALRGPLMALLITLVLVTIMSSCAALPTENKGDNCDNCGPTRLIGCRNKRCYYKCIRRCLGKDNKFYYEALKFNFAGQRR